jgi:hypothetical protein
MVIAFDLAVEASVGEGVAGCSPASPSSLISSKDIIARNGY